MSILRSISKLTRSFLLAASISALSAVLFAQEVGTGTVSGRVLNSATGKYMPYVVVRVPGTNISARTNNLGEYTLRNVPAGAATLHVEYVGLDNLDETVEVTAGGSVTQDFNLGSGARTDADGTVVLNEFVVQSARFKDAAEIAINAEKTSINIKNVVSTEEFGEIPGGNVGEFIKYLPGIELDYGGTYTAPTDATGISIRGFGAEDTNIMIDGVPVTAASQASLTNQVTLDMLSINNASRVELIKVPTPDMPMNSVGGQINLISKSAFEYAKPSFTYKAYVVVNSEHINPLDKVVGATDKKVYAGQPGFEFSYIKPVNDKLGITLTGSRFSQYSANRRLRPEYQHDPRRALLDLRPLGGERNTEPSNAEGTLSAYNPFLTRVSLTDSPRTSESYSASMKVDYKPFDGLALTGNYQYSTYDASDTDRRMQWRIQRPIDWGSDYTYSQPYMTSSQSVSGSSYNPGNSVGQDITSRDKSGETHSGYIKATYQKGGWDIKALASQSRSRASFHDFENGHFSGVDVSMSVGTLKFDDVVDGIPGKISVYDRTGLELNEIDYTKLENWGNPSIVGKRGNAESEDENELYQLDIRRELDFIPTDVVRLAFKTGIRQENITKTKWGLGTGYRETYVGPTISGNDILDTIYDGTSPGWNQQPQQFVSTYKLYDIWEANPEYFEVTENDAKENYWSNIGQNKALFEDREAWYAQIEGSALDDRLHFVAGLRDETITREGYGPQGDGRWQYIKNPDGTLYRNESLVGGTGTVRLDQGGSPLFATDATGTALRADLDSKGITYPTAAVGGNTLERAMLERKTGEFYGKSEGDPNYSINVSYDVTKKFVVKGAYSVTSGRISIEDATRGVLSGNQNDFRITEDSDRLDNGDGTFSSTGVISIANPNLLPESSKNWDLGLSYYNDFGGKFGISGYLKQIENYTENYITTAGDPLFQTILGTLGLDYETYRHWEIRTSENGTGTGEAWGYELDARQDLRALSFLGDAGKRIQFFATYSHSERPVNVNNPNRLSSRPAASNLSTGGIAYNGDRFSLSVRAAWRDYVFNGDKFTFTDTNGDSISVGEFIPASLKVDVSASYRLTEKTSVYISARNVLEEGNDKQRYDALGIYPNYARWDDYRDTGVQITIGVNGKF